MNPQIKLTATIIWFAILTGVFIFLQFLGGGLSSLSPEINIQSMPLFLVGFIPLLVAVVGRALVIPAANNDEDFMRRLIVCLALCEAPVIMSIFVFPEHLTTEKTFSFVASVIALIFLFPLNMSYGDDTAS